MAFISAREKERLAELLRRWNGQLPPLDEMVQYASSVYSEGRQDERRECSKCANEVMLNSIKAQAKEVGKSDSGINFQSGRRKGAEDIIGKIAARSILQLSEDSKPDAYPEAQLTAERTHP